jgi:RHS repeat-associated protein
VERCTTTHSITSKPTLVTDNAGGLLNDSDFYPYDSEVPITTADANHYKFTGKERDRESGNDYFGARYYSGAMGRFMSPDWSALPRAVPYASLENPQSLNLYGYAGNNPLSKTDPDGHCYVDGESHGGVWCLLHTIGFTETAASDY